MQRLKKTKLTMPAQNSYKITGLMKNILVLMTSLVVLTQLASSQTREDFTLGGLSAFVITPTNPAPGKPWIAYGPSVGGLPNWTGTGEEKWMFDRYFAAGIAVAGIYSGDLSGNVAQRAGYTLLYNELVNNRSYAPRFCFHARSRGGLISYNWAADNPGKVAAIGGIYPVTNLLSYPGETTAAAHYGVTVAQLNADIALYSPIERLAPLFNSGVQLFHIHGDNDGVVPLSGNSQITKNRYDALGGTMTLKVIPGGGHDLNPYWFQDQDLTDFMIARSRETVGIAVPPTLNTQTLVTPADGATDVAPSSNLTASFSEPIALTGTGSILLKNLSGGADVTINLPSDVSISANVLTINPPTNLIGGQQYAVEISNNTIRDLALTPSNYGGLQVSSSPNWNFTTQAQPPAAVVVNPSFELDVVADDSFSSAGAIGWTKTGSPAAGPQDYNATQNPQATNGEQHAFANGGSSLSQVTPFIVEAGKTYTLLVDVGVLTNFPGSLGTIRLFGNTLGINTPLANANGTAQLASIAPAAGSYLTNRTVTYTALASGDPFLGQQIGIALVGQSGIQVLFDNVRLTSLTNNYAAWIAGFANVGAQTGFNQDADGDSIPNGVEAFFGTNPDTTSLGINQVGRSGNTVTFQHREAAVPLSDVVGTYQWSLDLISWHAAGATSSGVTVAIPEPPAPAAGITTVSANVTAGSPPKLFLRLVVTLLP